MVEEKGHPRHGNDQECWYVNGDNVIGQLAFEYHHNTQAAIEP